MASFVTFVSPSPSGNLVYQGSRGPPSLKVESHQEQKQKQQQQGTTEQRRVRWNDEKINDSNNTSRKRKDRPKEEEDERLSYPNRRNPSFPRCSDSPHLRLYPNERNEQQQQQQPLPPRQRGHFQILESIRKQFSMPARGTHFTIREFSTGLDFLLANPATTATTEHLHVFFTRHLAAILDLRLDPHRDDWMVPHRVDAIHACLKFFRDMQEDEKNHVDDWRSSNDKNFILMAEEHALQQLASSILHDGDTHPITQQWRDYWKAGFDTNRSVLETIVNESRSKLKKQMDDGAVFGENFVQLQIQQIHSLVLAASTGTGVPYFVLQQTIHPVVWNTKQQLFVGRRVTNRSRQTRADLDLALLDSYATWRAAEHLWNQRDAQAGELAASNLCRLVQGELQKEKKFSKRAKRRQRKTGNDKKTLKQINHGVLVGKPVKASSKKHACNLPESIQEGMNSIADNSTENIWMVQDDIVLPLGDDIKEYIKNKKTLQQLIDTYKELMRHWTLNISPPERFARNVKFFSGTKAQLIWSQATMSRLTRVRSEAVQSLSFSWQHAHNKKGKCKNCLFCLLRDIFIATLRLQTSGVGRPGDSLLPLLQQLRPQLGAHKNTVLRVALFVQAVAMDECLKKEEGEDIKAKIWQQVSDLATKIIQCRGGKIIDLSNSREAGETMDQDNNRKSSETNSLDTKGSICESSLSSTSRKDGVERKSTKESGKRTACSKSQSNQGGMNVVERNVVESADSEFRKDGVEKHLTKGSSKKIECNESQGQLPPPDGDEKYEQDKTTKQQPPPDGDEEYEQDKITLQCLVDAYQKLEKLLIESNPSWQKLEMFCTIVSDINARRIWSRATMCHLTRVRCQAIQSLSDSWLHSDNKSGTSEYYEFLILLNKIFIATHGLQTFSRSNHWASLPALLEELVHPLQLGEFSNKKTVLHVTLFVQEVIRTRRCQDKNKQTNKQTKTKFRAEILKDQAKYFQEVSDQVTKIIGWYSGDIAASSYNKGACEKMGHQVNHRKDSSETDSLDMDVTIRESSLSSATSRNHVIKRQSTKVLGQKTACNKSQSSQEERNVVESADSASQKDVVEKRCTKESSKKIECNESQCIHEGKNSVADNIVKNIWSVQDDVLLERLVIEYEELETLLQNPTLAQSCDRLRRITELHDSISNPQFQAVWERADVSDLDRKRCKAVASLAQSWALETSEYENHAWSRLDNTIREHCVKVFEGAALWSFDRDKINSLHASLEAMHKDTSLEPRLGVFASCIQDLLSFVHATALEKLHHRNDSDENSREKLGWCSVPVRIHDILELLDRLAKEQRESHKASSSERPSNSLAVKQQEYPATPHSKAAIPTEITTATARIPTRASMQHLPESSEASFSGPPAFPVAVVKHEYDTAVNSIPTVHLDTAFPTPITRSPHGLAERPESSETSSSNGPTFSVRVKHEYDVAANDITAVHSNTAPTTPNVRSPLGSSERPESSEASGTTYPVRVKHEHSASNGMSTVHSNTAPPTPSTRCPFFPTEQQESSLASSNGPTFPAVKCGYSTVNDTATTHSDTTACLSPITSSPPFSSEQTEPLEGISSRGQAFLVTVEHEFSAANDIDTAYKNASFSAATSITPHFSAEKPQSSVASSNEPTFPVTVKEEYSPPDSTTSSDSHWNPGYMISPVQIKEEF